MKVMPKSISEKEAKNILEKLNKFKDNSRPRVGEESAFQKCKRGSEIYLEANFHKKG